MYFLYVDESGDSGLVNSPTRYFTLTGIVVHEVRWAECLYQLIEFRKRMRNKFGLLLRDEIHSARLINKPGSLVRIKRNDRLTIIRNYILLIRSLPDISIINIVIDKSNKPSDYDVMTRAWEALIQRFSNTMIYRNFPGPMNSDERGMIIPDNSDIKKITSLLRKMRHYNPIPSRMGGYRNLMIPNLVEDPFFKDSQSSYFIQSADVVAFCLYQKLNPSSYIKQKSAHNYFSRLDPVLCKAASSNDPEGIVRL